MFSQVRQRARQNFLVKRVLFGLQPVNHVHQYRRVRGVVLVLVGANRTPYRQQGVLSNGVGAHCPLLGQQSFRVRDTHGGHKQHFDLAPVVHARVRVRPLHHRLGDRNALRRTEDIRVRYRADINPPIKVRRKYLTAFAGHFVRIPAVLG